MSAIDIDDLSSAIIEELNNYSDEVMEQIKDSVKEVAKECAREIRKKAPRLSGDYAKSWTVKKVYESETDIRVVIHSPKEYRLAHLLEYGHAKAGGGSVEGKPHIRPAAQNAENKLLKKVKVVISGGN